MQLRRLPSELSEKRELAYLFKEFDDIGLQRKVLNYVTDDEIADHVINFFFEGSALIYPPKSYFVAIVYAACMCKYFPKYFTSLKEPLMCYDLIDKDDFFRPYSSATSKLYNKILDELKDRGKDILTYESTIKTHRYFKEEFLITEEEIAGIR